MGQGSYTSAYLDQRGSFYPVEICWFYWAALAFKRLGLGDFDHVAKAKAARWIADSWLEKPATIGQDVLNNAAALFRALNSRFTSTRLARRGCASALLVMKPEVFILGQCRLASFSCLLDLSKSLPLGILFTRE
jgi:hypothetical protein